MELPLRKKERTIGDEQKPTGFYCIYDSAGDEVVHDIEEETADWIVGAQDIAAKAIAQRDELATVLYELERAALLLAQCWNQMDSSEGVSAVESAAARQAVNVARTNAKRALRGVAIRTEQATGKAE